MSGLEQKAKTLKVGVVPWQLWIKSPAYLKLTPEKKIKSLLTIIERLIAEIAKLKELLKNYNDQALAYEKSVEDRFGQIREHTKNFPTLEEGKITEVWKLKSWKDRLVGLLGQKEEKPK